MSFISQIKRRLFKFKSNSPKLSANSASIFDFLTKDKIAIDCGANVGNVTEKMAAKGSKVYAFEPNPFAFKVLKERFAGNENIVCINKGVWDKDSIFQLFLHENSDQDQVHWSTGSSMLSFKNNVIKERFVEIETIDLSRFISELGKAVALLKIDVEGVEIEILNKLIDTGIINKVDKVYVETHDHKIPELKESTDALRKRIKDLGLINVNLDWI